MSDYTKTTWVSGTAPGIDAPALNNIETGVDTAHDEIALRVAKAGDSMSGPLTIEGTGALCAMWFKFDNGMGLNSSCDFLLAETIGPVDQTNRTIGGSGMYTGKIFGYIQPLYSETYTFYVTGDDGVRLYVAKQELIGELDWVLRSTPTVTANTIALLANKWVPIVLEHFTIDGSVNERLLLEWQSASQARQTIPANKMKWSLIPDVPMLDAEYMYAHAGMKVKSYNVWHGGNLVVASSAPSGPANGDIWIDTSITL